MCVFDVAAKEFEVEMAAASVKDTVDTSLKKFAIETMSVNGSSLGDAFLGPLAMQVNCEEHATTRGRIHLLHPNYSVDWNF